MLILVTIMFLLPLGLLTLHLYLSGCSPIGGRSSLPFFVLLVFFALTIGIGGSQLSYQGYNLPATTPVSLSAILSEP